MTNSEGFPTYELAGNGKTITWNSDVADDFGSFWYMDGEMAGWDSPDGRVTMLTKIGNTPNADGEYPADNHYRGRSLTWTMHASCTSEEARENSRLLLARVLDLAGTNGTLTVNEEVPKRCTIQRTGNSNQGKLVMTDEGLSSQPVSTPGFSTAPPDDKGVVYLLKADIEIYATDPRKYSPLTNNGPNPIESDTFTITNAGNTDSTNWFILIIGGVVDETGPLHITLVNDDNPDGVTMDLVVPTLPSGAPALSLMPATIGIDFLTNTITDGDGNNIYYLRDLRTPWLVLAPGDNTVTFTGIGEIDGSVTWNDAWI